MTFKELRKIIEEKNKALERESRSYDPKYYWEGRKVISLNHWLKIKSDCGLKIALQYFPNDFPRSGLTFILCGIEDQTLMQEAELWCSDFERLMEYGRNAEYGKTKCFRCLISRNIYRNKQSDIKGLGYYYRRYFDLSLQNTQQICMSI